MFDERAYIARLESAGVEELARMLARPTAEEETALRVYLGDDRYRSMHDRALERGLSRRGADRPVGNVVVIPGTMGSHLSAVDPKGVSDRIWLDIPGILRGRLDRLRLGDNGRSGQHDVRASGILKRYYGDLLLSLSRRWTVRAFWFDWRKDLNLAADELKAQLSNWFDDDAPVHIVAHSMGGLVARTFIKNHPERWKTMLDERSAGRAGGRLIMLGTPNHGSLSVVQIITGLLPIVRWLARADLFHSLDDLLGVLGTFVGTYQMLPSPLRVAEMERLYRSATYGRFGVQQGRLDNALKHHEALKEVADAGRMTYVAGSNRTTFGGITDFERLDKKGGYSLTEKGDGTVSHELGLLKTREGEDVRTYYVDEDHLGLTSNERVFSALEELLESGTTGVLGEEIPAVRGVEAGDARERLDEAEAAEERRLEVLLGRNSARGEEPSRAAYVRSDEREIEDVLVRGLVTSDGLKERREERKEVPFGPAKIEIGLECGEIETLPYEDLKSEDGSPVDAISVGHYINVRPQEAELALDQAISRSLSGRSEGSDLPESELLLTQYFERGIIRGRLGQPFFLPDPRLVDGEGTGRVIAIAGMGLPGGFGVPELTVLARELCWSLGQMEKRHLATVLIGSGKGNLSSRDAVSAWMRGVKHALTGLREEEGRRLVRITFVESDPEKVEEAHEAILYEKGRLEQQQRLLVDYGGIKEGELRRKKEEYRRRTTGGSETRGTDPVPARITLALNGDAYKFGAITDTAAVPEREIMLDKDLVMEANEELAAERDPGMQGERGRFLEKLLVPEELREQFSTDAPLVMMLDPTTARIHWEMVAQPDPTLRHASGEASRDFDRDAFLGTARGFTRQLRTTFAPPPEPPPPPQRVMRVLVVADPAGDAHLPGAEEEGIEVASLFESFNAAHVGGPNRVQVERMFGPYEAKRTNVMRRLMLRSYDVLHFAGHCVYDHERPERSGWIFSEGERLTAGELSRVDRVPTFVFSNACESGVTPDRSELRSVELAPTFAEAFFERGVTNFVCTAWPVDDVAAREFALALYALLLGLARPDAREGCRVRTVPQPMHAAMREARIAVADVLGDTRTWGAYQHYGSPYFRFFEPTAMDRIGPENA